MTGLVFPVGLGRGRMDIISQLSTQRPLEEKKKWQRASRCAARLTQRPRSTDTRARRADRAVKQQQKKNPPWIIEVADGGISPLDPVEDGHGHVALAGLEEAERPSLHQRAEVKFSAQLCSPHHPPCSAAGSAGKDRVRLSLNG